MRIEVQSLLGLGELGDYADEVLMWTTEPLGPSDSSHSCTLGGPGAQARDRHPWPYMQDPGVQDCPHLETQEQLALLTGHLRLSVQASTGACVHSIISALGGLSLGLVSLLPTNTGSMEGHLSLAFSIGCPTVFGRQGAESSTL